MSRSDDTDPQINCSHSRLSRVERERELLVFGGTGGGGAIYDRRLDGVLGLRIASQHKVFGASPSKS